MPTDLSPILLILDVDETLIHATESVGPHLADFQTGPYFVYRRPGLDEFFSSLRDHFTIAVWSSSDSSYLAAVLAEVFPKDLAPAFVWDRSRCTTRIDHERQKTYFAKNLKKVKSLGYNHDRVLINDDSHEKIDQYYGNAIYVTSWFGDPRDSELPRLANYLLSIRHQLNLRSFEKRSWRNHSNPWQSQGVSQSLQHAARRAPDVPYDRQIKCQQERLSTVRWIGMG